jgi:hypothetical protein
LSCAPIAAVVKWSGCTLRITIFPRRHGDLLPGQRAGQHLCAGEYLRDITDTYVYDAFGPFYSQTGVAPNPHRYIGQCYEAAANLYSLRTQDCAALETASY